ncbi:ribokinase [Gordonia sp. TBRC 11910]|uniref:Ribokinase n=1 Tax=Gordonia asplenii TaxID=2725283 RepID=A0A848L823_9ACTN|nr:ribokinase [Gordonia asplenii]NMO05125.1 ribokinase [Gordonia asplenii]
MSRVVVVGSLNMDLLVHTERRPSGGETVAGSDLLLGPGGKSANQAVAAARLGAHVTMIGAVGRDVFGQRLRAFVDAEGIDTDGITTIDDVATGTAVIIVDDEGENSIVVSSGANARVTGEWVEARRSMFDAASVVVLCLEIPLDGVLAAARAGHAAGATVILNLSPYIEVPDELLMLTDVLLVNEHECRAAVGADLPWDEAAVVLVGNGVGRAIVTLGARGSVVLDATSVTEITSIQVAVADTTGCGDAYTGTIAAGLARGLGLVDAAHAASRVSAAAATRVGASASYPSSADATRLAWGDRRG